MFSSFLQADLEVYFVLIHLKRYSTRFWLVSWISPFPAAARPREGRQAPGTNLMPEFRIQKKTGTGILICGVRSVCIVDDHPTPWQGFLHENLLVHTRMLFHWPIMIIHHQHKHRSSDLAFSPAAAFLCSRDVTTWLKDQTDQIQSLKAQAGTPAWIYIKYKRILNKCRIIHSSGTIATWL